MKLARSIHPGDKVMKLRLKDEGQPRIIHMIVGFLAVETDHVIEPFET